MDKNDNYQSKIVYEVLYGEKVVDKQLKEKREINVLSVGLYMSGVVDMFG